MKHIMAVSVLAICLMFMGSGCATSRIATGEPQIRIDATGTIAVQGQRTSIADLQQNLANLGFTSDRTILISADKQADYKHVIAVLDELRRLDLWNISFKTTQ